MNPIKLSMIIALAVASSACSNTPSESDAKQVIQNLLGDCSHLSLERFEKTNGRAIDKQNYIVEIAYSIRVDALPESRKMVEDVTAQLAELDARIEKAVQERDPVETEYQNCNASESSCSQDEFLSIINRQTPLRQAVWSLEAEKSIILKNIKDPLDKKFAKECPNVNSALYANLYKAADAAQYAKDFTKEFSGTITMFKTENGWQAAM